MNALLAPADRTGREDVLNGIAYDADKKRIFVTGKRWPRIFEIKIK
jgi:glutaminyl-peptide cyclotransferase